MTAANVTDLEQRLKRTGLDLISCRAPGRNQALIGRGRVGRVELIKFCLSMEQLSNAGVLLLEALADLRDSVDHPRLKEVIANLIEEVEGGRTLSAAMAGHPAVFDSLFVNLIQAGEASGQMAEVFGSLGAILKWQDELAAHTKKVLLFPAFVGLVVFGATFFLMVYLVPQLVSFIMDMGQTLPLHTRALIAVSNFCINYWYAIVFCPPLLWVGARTAADFSPGFRFFVDDLKLRVWLIGPVLKKIILSRFANFFAMLYAAGIPIIRCMEISEGVVNNVVLREALQRAGEDISDGYGISNSFGNTGMFPALVIRMLKVGETTGELDKSLMNVSYFFEREVKELIAKLQSMIQPVMTLVLGSILGWVMLSVLGPIYDTISKLSY
jgi:type IV pilus assembly protein PilC